MNILNKQENLVDTAVGPVTVTISQVTDFDVEDYAHMAVRSMALKLQLKIAVQTADTRFTSGRDPVTVDDVSVGGY